MTFDERLRELVESLADRLRHEAAGHFQESMGDLHGLLRAERAAAVSEAVREARESAEREADNRLEAAIAEGLREAHEKAERETHERIDVAVREAREIAEREAGQRLEAAVAEAVREAHETVERDVAARLESRIADAAREVRETAERDAAQRLEAAVADAARDARATVEREAAERVTALVAEAEARAHDAGRKEGQEAGAEAGKDTAKAIERLAAATRLVDEARSLSEILDALADAARREAGSAALFLVRGDELRSWRLSGFGRALDEAARFDIPMSDAGLLAEAVRERNTVLANSADEASVPGFVSLPPGRQMLAVPVCLSGDVVAVLYADQGENVEPRPAWPAALEILVRHASRWLEAVTAFRAAKLISGNGSSVEFASETDGAESTGQDGRASVVNDSGNLEDSHAARRYARLLISDIKLYHESDVLAGRRARDLATRLGGEIARARALYEQRVAPHARSGADHFHAELVSTLANGDASLLGNQ